MFLIRWFFRIISKKHTEKKSFRQEKVSSKTSKENASPNTFEKQIETIVNYLNNTSSFLHNDFKISSSIDKKNPNLVTLQIPTSEYELLNYDEAIKAKSLLEFELFKNYLANPKNWKSEKNPNNASMIKIKIKEDEHGESKCYLKITMSKEEANNIYNKIKLRSMRKQLEEKEKHKKPKQPILKTNAGKKSTTSAMPEEQIQKNLNVFCDYINNDVTTDYIEPSKTVAPFNQYRFIETEEFYNKEDAETAKSKLFEACRGIIASPSQWDFSSKTSTNAPNKIEVESLANNKFQVIITITPDELDKIAKKIEKIQKPAPEKKSIWRKAKPEKKPSTLQDLKSQ